MSISDAPLADMKKQDLLKAMYPIRPAQAVAIRRCIGLNKPFTVISEKSYISFKKSFVISGNHETGGLLLGKIRQNHFCIESITVSKQCSDKNYSFELNLREHINKANAIIKKYNNKIRIIGIWHSHPADYLKFSSKDMEANQEFAGLYGKTVSALLRNSRNSLLISSWKIEPNKTDIKCKTLFKHRRFPMEREERCSNCKYWKFGKCIIIDEYKKDSICICGEFKKKDEIKD